MFGTTFNTMSECTLEMEGIVTQNKTKPQPFFPPFQIT